MSQNEANENEFRAISDFGDYPVLIAADIENRAVFVNVRVIESSFQLAEIVPIGDTNDFYPFAESIFTR